MAKMGSVHEPEAELLSAEDAIHDVAQLKILLRERLTQDRAVPVQLPLSALLEAIDHLQPGELQQLVTRARDRLATGQ